MALVEYTLLGKEDKVADAIKRLKSFEPPEGYYLAFSGGKDSLCIYHLAKMAGVKFDAHYSVTSVDPPELMRFIRDNYPDVEWERHYWNDGKPEHYFPDGTPRQITMWNLIESHTIPPTRQARYCCSALKEVGGVGRLVVTGVRWAESARRNALHGVADIQTGSKKLHKEASDNPAYKMNKLGGMIFMDDNSDTRRMVEQCYTKRKTTINPIVDWLDEDVWEFLNDVAKVPHCSLYDEGFTRIGCIGCPLQGKNGMLKDFERWPRYKELYIKAFDAMILRHSAVIRVANGEPAEIGGGAALGAVHQVDHISTTGTQEAQKQSCGLLSKQSCSAYEIVGGRPQSELAREKMGDKIRRMELSLLDRKHIQITGNLFFQYWIWRCREDQMDWSEHPFHKSDPKKAQYEGAIITIRE